MKKIIVPKEYDKMKKVDGLKISAKRILCNIIKNVVAAWIQQTGGMAYEDRQTYYKLFDAIDKQAMKEDGFILIDDAWYDFVKKCFSEVKVVPDEFMRKAEKAIFEN